MLDERSKRLETRRRMRQSTAAERRRIARMAAEYPIGVQR